MSRLFSHEDYDSEAFRLSWYCIKRHADKQKQKNTLH